ncbi:glutathione S-transferase [Phialemonium atrogriseum]|uniref:Glutathione S-transferase n=1 Tax=Phialemonium atrogriseum TaxID=1093897 RepID=A0AAJ0BR35_9PEZI|nr:glutathione S-transferase [Phialemonium atrogriseum]KAK1761853.1 glutathione S-transferase [Phialemonium atrogriseum]
MARTPDITLYTWLTANGIKISIALEELSLPYRAVEVDISTNEQKEPWFLKINPNGRIPAITDGGQRVFESGSILLYLVDKYDPERSISYEPGTPEYYEQLGWLMFQMGGVGPMQGQANHFRMMASTYSEYGINRYMNETKRLYSVLNSRLESTPFLAGSKYTIADIANYAWIRYGPIALEIDLDEFPALKRWHDGIYNRRAVHRGLAVPRQVSEEQTAQRYRSMRQKMDARKLES